MFGSAGSLLKGRWSIWILAFVFALLAGGGVLSLVSSAAQQSTYYVTAVDVPADTQITRDMLASRTVNSDGMPHTALSLEQIEANTLYALIPLRQGEPITTSNVTSGQRINADAPENFIAVSLAVAPEDAVAGRVRAGDRVAIVAQDDETGDAITMLSDVLVLSVRPSASTISDSATNTGLADETGTSGGGIPQLYTFAISPDDLDTMATLRTRSPYLAILPLDADGNVIGQALTATETSTASPTALPTGSTTTDETTTNDGTATGTAGGTGTPGSPTAAPSPTSPVAGLTGTGTSTGTRTTGTATPAAGTSTNRS